MRLRRDGWRRRQGRQRLSWRGNRHHPHPRFPLRPQFLLVPPWASLTTSRTPSAQSLTPPPLSSPCSAMGPWWRMNDPKR